MAFAVPFVSNIAGVSFTNSDGTSRQEYVKALYTGERLYLKDTSSDKYPESIGVFNSFDEQLGNLPKDNAILIRKQKIDFTSLWCIVGFHGQSPHSGFYGAKIAVAKTESEANDLAAKIESGDVPFYYTRTPTEYSQPTDTYKAMREAEDRDARLKLKNTSADNGGSAKRHTASFVIRLIIGILIVLGPILAIIIYTLKTLGFLFE